MPWKSSCSNKSWAISVCQRGWQSRFIFLTFFSSLWGLPFHASVYPSFIYNSLINLYAVGSRGHETVSGVTHECCNARNHMAGLYCQEPGGLTVWGWHQASCSWLRKVIPTAGQMVSYTGPVQTTPGWGTVKNAMLSVLSSLRGWQVRRKLLL